MSGSTFYGVTFPMLAVLWNKDDTIEVIQAESPYVNVGPDRLQHETKELRFPDDWGTKPVVNVLTVTTERSYVRIAGLPYSYREV